MSATAVVGRNGGKLLILYFYDFMSTDDNTNSVYIVPEDLYEIHFTALASHREWYIEESIHHVLLSNINNFFSLHIYIPQYCKNLHSTSLV